MTSDFVSKKYVNQWNSNQLHVCPMKTNIVKCILGHEPRCSGYWTSPVTT